jgi:hypothetical protein
METINIADAATLRFKTRGGIVTVSDPVGFYDSAIRAGRVEGRSDIEVLTDLWGIATAGGFASYDAGSSGIECPSWTEISLIFRHIEKWMNELGKDGATGQTSSPKLAS